VAANRATVGLDELWDIAAPSLRKLKNLRFVLDQPFIYQRPAGFTRAEAERAALGAALVHRLAMMKLVRGAAVGSQDGPLSYPKMLLLLASVLRAYVPAFSDPRIVPAKRAPGRPRRLTDHQKAAIDQAVAEGTSVLKACRRLARRDVKAAKALAAAYRRATKRVRRK
jgi:hypothetical protein